MLTSISTLDSSLFKRTLALVCSQHTDLEKAGLGKRGRLAISHAAQRPRFHTLRSSHVATQLPCQAASAALHWIGRGALAKVSAKHRKQNCIGSRARGGKRHIKDQTHQFDRDEFVAQDIVSQHQRNRPCRPPKHSKTFAAQQNRIRQMVDDGKWFLHQSLDGSVRPPEKVRGERCVLAELGECGDPKCGCYRLGTSSARVRPSFLDFCVEHIRSAVPRETQQEGITYCSLACGQLYFDWEIIERLIVREGISVRDVYLVDIAYDDRKVENSHLLNKAYAELNLFTEANLALRAFRKWFDKVCYVSSFSSADDFRNRISSGKCAKVDVLVQCDASAVDTDIDVVRFRESVLQRGGISLVLLNPAQRKLFRKQIDGSVSNVIDERWYCDEWWDCEALEKNRISLS